MSSECLLHFYRFSTMGMWFNSMLNLLSSVDALYHGALRFITDCTFITHHCELYERVAWPSLRIRRKMHCICWYRRQCWSFAKLSLLFYTKEFIWKSLCSQSNYNLCYNPFVRTQLGKPIWNMLPPQTAIFSKGRWSYKTWCLIIIWSPYYVI